jgi:hypothetical protein
LVAEEEKLSRFELFCLTWFCENVTQFTREAGLVAEMFKELELKGLTKRLFVMGLTKIHRQFEDIAGSEAKSAGASNG